MYIIYTWVYALDIFGQDLSLSVDLLLLRLGVRLALWLYRV